MTDARVLLLVLILLLVPGAAVMAEQAEFDDDDSIDLVWPPKPLPPRIRYVGSIASPDDVEPEEGKSFWEKFWEALHGAEQENQAKPMAVAVDSQGRLNVADPAGKLVHIYDQKKGEYAFIESADVPFLLPIGLAVDAQDNLYVSDGLLRKIAVFSPKGDYIRSIGGPRQLQRPTSITLDPARRVLYVVDTPAHDIKVFNLINGALIRTIGERGREDGEFNFPTYSALDNTGRLYVNDTLNGRIQMFDPDGKFISQFGQFGDGSGDFATPKGVAVDSDGNIYIMDAGFDNLQIFDDQGRLLLFLGITGQAPGEFWMPAGLFIDKNDRLYVADSYNRRVQIFQYLKVGAEQ